MKAPQSPSQLSEPSRLNKFINPSNQVFIRDAWWDGWKEPQSPSQLSEPSRLDKFINPSNQVSTQEAWWEGWRQWTRTPHQISLSKVMLLLYLLFVIYMFKSSTMLYNDTCLCDISHKFQVLTVQSTDRSMRPSIPFFQLQTRLSLRSDNTSGNVPALRILYTVAQPSQYPLMTARSPKAVSGHDKDSGPLSLILTLLVKSDGGSSVASSC